MTPKDDLSGPAFPARFTNDGDGNTFAPDGQIVPPGMTVDMMGMTLRDWFAGQALAGFIAAHAENETPLPASKAAASHAYSYADAMIAERHKPRSSDNG